jgi:riboflavin kinase/FMN adenylyltransferase
MLKKLIFSKLNENEPTVMLLGGFDGLHVGHRRLLERAKTLSLPVGVMTIEGGKGEKSLFTGEERVRIFSRLGVDFSYLMPFEEIKALSPQSFIELLKKECNAVAFVCGEDFRFGAGAKGSAGFLKETEKEVYVEKLLFDGERKIGASLIKECLREGDVQTATRLLGEEFFLVGEVVRDRGVGRTIGFPTANIRCPESKYPLRTGVYETRVSVDGKEYKGITNYGARPTFDNGDIVTETHLIAYTGDLYGKTLEIKFVRWLREIERFESVDELILQLEKDKRRVLTDD